MSNDLTVYEPRNFGELEAFANRVVRTNLVPQAYRGKPDDALVAMMFGKETGGLGPLTSLQFIAVINGRPGYYSDAVPGVALNKGLIIDIEETEEGIPYEDGYKRVCVITKANGRKTRTEFSVSDAKRAGLWDKAGPWKQYPKRMLQWRAKGYGVRDAAPHMLFGNTVEELRDLEEQPHTGADRAKDITPVRPPADDILLCDHNGEEFGVLAGEARDRVQSWCRECTDEELQLLVENNSDVPWVAEVVEEETARRAKTSAPQEEAMLEIVKICGEDGNPFYTGSIFREAVEAYGAMKKAAKDKAAVAVKNLPALKVLKDHAEGKTFERLGQEIEAAEVAASQYDDQPAPV